MPKDILHIITRLDKGGSAENVIITCRKTDKNKFNSILVYGSTGIPALSLDVPVIEVPVMVRSISPLKDICAFFALFKLILDKKPAIVHTHSSKAGFLGRWAAWLSNIVLRVTRLFGGQAEWVPAKIIHTPHGHVFYGYEFSSMKTKLYILLERITAPITDTLIALTEGEKNESLSFGVGTHSQWQVVHSAVNQYVPSNDVRNSIRKEFSIPDDTLIIGSVGRFEPVKGMLYFMDAVIEIKKIRPGLRAKFLFVGDGSERPLLEEKMKQNKLEASVLFTGMKENAMDIMSAMDIYVQPSVNEGMGKTIVQAQAAGVPVIASRVQGIPDAMKENTTGILVPAKDPAALAQAILKLAGAAELRESMSAAARQFVRDKVDGYDRFSTERMIFLLEKIYEKAIH